MIELPVYNRQGEQVGTVEVDEADFGGEIRHRVLRDAIVMYEKAQRVGTASTRTRSEVKGSGAKPWRQKGTGRARAGSRRSPIWRGGGVAFGPKPRQFTNTMPRKALRAASKSAYLAKFHGATTVLDALRAEEPKTRDLAATLKALGIQRSCLIAIEAYDLLRHHRLVITRAALDKLVEVVRPSRKRSVSEGTGPAPAAGRPDEVLP